MMFPKPTYPKQKKAKNNKRLVDYHACECCGTVTFCETHEIFGGPLRQLCIKFGKKLQRILCPKCHALFTNEDERIKKTQLRWRQEAQLEFEAEHGHTMWMKLFMRNWL